MPLGLLRRRHARTGTADAPLLPAPPRGAGVVSCEVHDPMGTALRGADITVFDPVHRLPLVTATSDPFGWFAAALPPGEYQLAVTADSLEPVRSAVTVTAGQRSHVGPFQLMPSPLKELPVPGAWDFDPPHTAIRFIAQHVGMAHVHGRFTDFEGGIRIGERMEDSSIEITIEAGSLTTGNRTRDTHLRSADFLDVKRYPYLHFASDRLVHRHGAKWTVHGALTMHGTSRSVQLDTTYLGMVNGGYGEELRCAALATTELHREDFTLNWRSMLARGIAVVGPRIKLELDVQAMFRCEDTPTPPE
ncbi:YceI family protein [Streptacidiphilus sp. ASG 303]|uniref:YceI family protein n=1 Tax=Streptacidiphilus sp. ASG 303 TaxID=2896847 RepID=UPI001E564857|nr:YceI family protein [Streptacidiphilus sp. ASG 303]MCD0481608.1 YceI family protein [Streptacidiphilus sp. ASG 303]